MCNQMPALLFVVIIQKASPAQAAFGCEVRAHHSLATPTCAGWAVTARRLQKALLATVGQIYSIRPDR